MSPYIPEGVSRIYVYSKIIFFPKNKNWYVWIESIPNHVQILCFLFIYALPWEIYLWRREISLTCLTLPHVCVCPKPRPAFSTSYVVVFFHCSQWEELEDIKEVIRIRKSKKDRQHNGQTKKYKKTNNDQQNIHIKLKTE